jgi:hypothetical protein
MKLAKVEHYRCDQPAGKWGLSTYVWVPDTMTEEEFGDLCNKTATTYLDNERTWKSTAPVQPAGYAPSLDPIKDKGKTVEQVYDEWNEKSLAFKAYEAKRSAARKSFNELLIEASNGTIKYFWNGPVAFSHELSWGHNHGTEINMSPTKVGDYPADEDEDY